MNTCQDACLGSFLRDKSRRDCVKLQEAWERVATNEEVNPENQRGTQL
jgi:hypothetical protein